MPVTKEASGSSPSQINVQGQTRKDSKMTRQEWDAIRHQAERLLLDDPNINRFRRLMGKTFKAMLEEKPPPYLRRPIASLRLICDTERATKLVVHPGWSKPNVLLDRISIDVIQETIVTYRHTFPVEYVEDVRKFSKRITVRVNPDGNCIGAIYATAVEDVATIARCVKEFLDDGKAVFARSHDHCSCCGKSLTDERSRSRGIGPECIKVLDWLLVPQREWNQLVVQEAQA
jgi:Family of unknown function (DUF6011)